jgi:hypothetical protein
MWIYLRSIFNKLPRIFHKVTTASRVKFTELLINGDLPHTYLRRNSFYCETNFKYVRLKVFTAITILIIFFWIKSPCGLVDKSQRFGEA